jgi:hypothetical protein
LVTELTDKFLIQVRDICSAEAAAILVCDLQNVVINKCSATVSCENDGSATSYVCQADQAAKAVEQAFLASTTEPTADQTQSIATLTQPFSNQPGYDPTNAASMAYIYALQRCNSRVFSQQSTVLPLVQLTDCTGAVVTGLNSLNTLTRCNMGVLSELVPPDPVALQDIAEPVPIWQNALQMALLCGIFLVIVCAAILGAVGIANPPAKSMS